MDNSITCMLMVMMKHHGAAYVQFEEPMYLDKLD